MADTQETIADIIAEMRVARTEFPFVYLMGEPDTPEVVDFTTKEIIAPRKINIRQVTVKELADRLDAAHKRERGDCAKLREAVGYILKYADSVACRDHDEHTRHYIDQIRKWAQSALAAPPRNCDRFATVDEARKAHEEYRGDYIMRASNKFDFPMEFEAWLFAPATEKEGGANG